MGNIGEPVRHIELEPFPASVPIEAPAKPEREAAPA